MKLTVQPAKPFLVDKTSGYEIRIPNCGHHVQLQIGSVSIYFDDCNNYEGNVNGVVMEFSESFYCPVRLNGDECPKGDVAEIIMFAIAADLGYTLSK